MSSQPSIAVASPVASELLTPQDAMTQVAGAMMVAPADSQDGAGGKPKARSLFLRIGQAISTTVYATCYYTSYGVVFPTQLIVGLLPSENAIAYGLGDGARAAKDAVADLKAQRKARREAARQKAEAAKAAPALAPA